MKYLILIPARGGSKGIPKKNIKKLVGKPLIHYTIEAALELFDKANICVSTDSEEIKQVAEEKEILVPFLRPKELASDTAGSYEVILHALTFYEKIGMKFDGVILLQPTSPLRTGKHIKEAISLFNTNLDMVVSVKETNSNPYYVLFEEDNEGYLQKSKKGDFIRRQDCPKVWEYNGAIYIINVNTLLQNPVHKFKKIKKYIMNEEASVDIDSNLDWILAETIISMKKSKELNGI